MATVGASLAAALALTACSADPGPAASAPAATSSATQPSATQPTAAQTPPAGDPPTSGAASASPSPVATLAPGRCLTGRYALVRFVAVGGSTYGTGQGGDVTATFDDGRYVLRGAGRRPMSVTVGGQTGNLTVDGEAKGTWTRKGAVASFTPTSDTGGGTLDDGRGGKAAKLTMQQVDGVIGLAGDGQVACTAQAMTITLAAIRLELARA